MQNVLQRDFVLSVKEFEWIGGRPLDTIGEPADLDAEPEVLTLLEIFLNDDGDADRIPESQQVFVCRVSARSVVSLLDGVSAFLLRFKHLRGASAPICPCVSIATQPRVHPSVCAKAAKLPRRNSGGLCVLLGATVAEHTVESSQSGAQSFAFLTAARR